MNAPAPSGRLRTVSLRRRVWVGVLGVLALLLVALGLFVDVALGSQLRTDLRTRLTDRAALAVQLATRGADAQRVVDGAQGDGIQVEIVDADGTRYGSTPYGPRLGRPGTGSGPDGPDVADPPGAGPVPITEEGDLLVVERPLADGRLLRLAADESYVSDTLTRLRLFFLLGGVVTLTLAAVVLSGVVGRALRPLDAMTGLARSITHGNRGQRLRPDRDSTELGRTAVAFDEMLDELEGAERAATRAEAAMRDLLGDVAHELRTPVAGLQAAAEAMVSAGADRDQRERLAAALVRESQRAGRLVDDLLAMARIDGARHGRPALDLDRERLDLNDLAEQAVARMGLLAPGVRIERAGGPAVVVGDRERLAQVVGNLVDNAVRHGETVRLQTGGDGRIHWLDVLDDGPGVPEADRERIFDRLVRLDPARRRAARGRSGAGLGLSIARGLARAHGGDVVCRPALRGAHFRLTLPADPNGNTARRPA